MEERSKLDGALVLKATHALLKHLSLEKRKRPKEQLFDDDVFLSLQISVKRIPDQGTTKPRLLPLKHSIYSEATVCVITKDPQKHYRQVLSELQVPVEKIIGISKLRKYPTYEDKRRLCNSFDLFLADRDLLDKLSPLLGKVFFKTKKQPALIKLTPSCARQQVERARNSTVMLMAPGACCSVRIGRSSFSADEIAANIHTAFNAFVQQLPGGFENVNTVHLTAPNSLALPLLSPHILEALSNEQESTAEASPSAASASEPTTTTNPPGETADSADEQPAAAKVTRSKRKRALSGAPAMLKRRKHQP